MLFKRKPYGTSGKQKNTESTAMVLKRWCGRLTDFLVCIWIMIITAVLPLYFKEGYGYIATDKSLFFRQASITMGKVLVPVLAVYLVLYIAVWVQKRRAPFREDTINTSSSGGPSVETRFSAKGFCGRPSAGNSFVKMTDFFALLYGAALVISYFCSDYREQAFWGAEGWYMGFFTQTVLLFVYFLIAKFWKPRKLYFYLMLAVSAAVFGLGYLNRFSVYPIEMEMSSPGFISTIGNINWYCGYAVTVFFGGAAILWQGGGKTGRYRSLPVLYVWLGFAAVITQGSASGILTLAVVMLLLFILSADEGERMCRFWMMAFLMGAACLFTEILILAAPDRMNFSDEIMNLMVTGAVPSAITLVAFVIWQWLESVVKEPADRLVRKKAAGSGKGDVMADKAKGKRGIARTQGYPKKQFRIAAAIIMTTVSLLFAVFVILMILNTLYPGRIGRLSEYGLFTFSDTWGSRRGATWKAGVRCFWEQDPLHKLVGVGPDSMEAFIYRDGSGELAEALRGVFGHNYLANAHNEWLTVLVNTGILGLAGFGGMMVSAMTGLMKRIGKNPVAAACGFALFAYTVNNIFSFQQIMNVTQAYVIMGMGMAFLREEKAVQKEECPQRRDFS